MKKNLYEYPKSSLLGMPKDASLIMSRILSNQNILKLLTYNTRDWKSQPAVSAEKVKEMFETQQISAVPRIKVDKSEKTYLRLIYGSMTRNSTNPEFRDNIISFDIICHFDVWNLGDLQLRPYKIAGQLDGMFNNTRLTGVGKINFLGASQIILNEEYAGLSLMYQIIHGEEDKG